VVAGRNLHMPVTVSDKGLLDPLTAGRVRLRRWTPTPGLQSVIERFWTLQFDVRRPEIQPLLPHPCVNIAFGTADPGVHGPVRNRDDHRIAGQGWVLAAKLRPGALVAMGLGRGPVLVDNCRPVSEVFGRPGHRVVQQITEDLDREKGAELIEGLLSRQLPIVDPVWDELTEVIATMLANRSLIRVTDAARATGISTRTLQRWFGHYLGLSPAWVLARYRLQDAAEVLAAGGPVDLADLATRLGYFDQAHFTRTFSAAVGMPPGAYARWCRERVAPPRAEAS
jgi:AraC-like DNA-binding protein